MRLSYRNNGYASSVVLAAFAREALGQWKILLALRREVIGGKPLTVSEVKNRCSSHVQKQAAGMLSITMRADQGHGAGQLLMSRMTAKPGSEEWKRTDDALTRIDRRMKREVPTERHERREVALYVDPIEPFSLDRWNRPSIEISRTLAHGFIDDARNDYAGQFHRYSELEILRGWDPALCGAIEQWSDRPTLLLPFQEPLPLF